MLNDNYGVSAVYQLLQHLNQLVHIRNMKAGRGLVQNINCPSGGTFGQFCCQLNPLCLSAGKRGRRLSDFDIAKSHILQRLQLAGNPRNTCKKFKSLFHRHFQHIIDAFALIFDFERFTVIAFSLAYITGNINIRQKMHFYFNNAVTLTGFTAPAFHIKRKTAGVEAAQLSVLRGCVQVADVRKHAGIGCRVGTGGSADGSLVDLDHLVQLRYAPDLFKGAGTAFRPVQLRSQIFI